MNHIFKRQWTKRLFKLFRLEVRLKCNDLERLCHQEAETWLKVYLDQKGLMYQGKLRISRVVQEKETYLILEDYQLYLLEKPQTISLIKEANSCDYVLIKIQDIGRIEVTCQTR